MKKKIALIFDETENITLTSERKYIMDIFKQNNKIIIDKDIKDNIPNHLKGLSKQQIKGLKKLYK